MSEVRITVLVDDLNGTKTGFQKSYGFSALIEVDKKLILFDVGTKPTPLISNIKTYGIKPASIDGIILSHNHYDHTDGLVGILRDSSDVPVYVHKDWDLPASFKGFQIPQRNRITIQEASVCDSLSKNIYLTNSYYAPDYGGVYEHACYVKSKNSYILICGCCHPGLNKFLNDRSPLGISEDASLEILGGMHAFRFTEKEAAMLRPNINSITLFHCTSHTEVFKNQFGDKCRIGIVGKTMRF
ncbi:MAG: MBL fold metallo-hydrolase [Candidatus Lokiarchaeota archaeon]|nr:MBL fold metallo-hydrolase [Candidatus Lokiarchaeota archaeon]MBD3338238.1 MBL fold metallo-hydrolase [Candidatus Lokiarchaeota archaeon]